MKLSASYMQLIINKTYDKIKKFYKKWYIFIKISAVSEQMNQPHTNKHDLFNTPSEISDIEKNI